MDKALILCRTPFQAYLLKTIIKKENIRSYDLVYYTDIVSPEDNHYYQQLKKNAETSKFIQTKIIKPNVLTYLEMMMKCISFLKNRGYSKVLLASFDNYIFNVITRMQKDAEIVTFDDGMGNVFSRSIYKEAYQGREKFYQILFGAYDKIEFCQKVKRHYTIYPNMQNIVPEEKVIGIFSSSENKIYVPLKQGPTFFIGQPFHLILDKNQIERVIHYLKSLSIDFYIKHPRERTILDIGAKEFDKKGKIAEEAISECTKNSKPLIIGLQSATLFNYPEKLAEKQVLLFKESKFFDDVLYMAKTTGCTVKIL